MEGERRFSFLFLILISVSSLIAFLQYLDIGMFWRIHEMLGKDPNLYVHALILSRERPVGLAQYFIPLSYQLTAALSISFYHMSRENSNSNTAIKSIFIILTLGILSSGTRSAILAVTIGLILLAIMDIKIKKIHAYLVIFLLTIISFVCISSIWHKNNRVFTIDSSIRFRIPLYVYYSEKITGKNVVSRNKSSERAVSRDSFSNFAKHFNVNIDKKAEISPHNQIINTIVLYGFGGGILLILYYLYLLKLGLKTNLSFVAPALVMNFTHSFFHNAGPFFGDYIWWHVCAVIVFLVVNKDKKANKL